MPAPPCSVPDIRWCPHECVGVGGPAVVLGTASYMVCSLASLVASRPEPATQQGDIAPGCDYVVRPVAGARVPHFLASAGRTSSHRAARRSGRHHDAGTMVILSSLSPRISWILLLSIFVLSFPARAAATGSACGALVMEAECKAYLSRLDEAGSPDERKELEREQAALIRERTRLCPRTLGQPDRHLPSSISPVRNPPRRIWM